MKRFLICTFLFIFLVPFAYADTVTETTVKVTHPAKHKATTREKIHQVLDKVTPTHNSALEQRIKEENQAEKNSISLTLYRPTYILPYYYTASPDYVVYNGQTPNKQKIMRNEFKAQLSLLVPIWKNMYGNPNWALNGAYTQLNYWQVYASSQYFREINYEPELFFEDHFHRNWLYRLGFDHQSNGRGGELERSWNRAVGTVQFSGDAWLVSLRVWALVFQHESSDIHNPDIAKFMGYDNLRFSYRVNKAVLSLEMQNLESGMRRGYVQATVSYPVLKHMSLYAQYFNGFGQSLIEYDHRTQGVGLGIAFNDWI